MALLFLHSQEDNYITGICTFCLCWHYLLFLFSNSTAAFSIVQCLASIQFWPSRLSCIIHDCNRFCYWFKICLYVFLVLSFFLEVNLPSIVSLFKERNLGILESWGLKMGKKTWVKSLKSENWFKGKPLVLKNLKFRNILMYSLFTLLLNIRSKVNVHWCF